MYTYNVYQTVALLSVSWNVVVLWINVLMASSFSSRLTLVFFCRRSFVIIVYSACPCHTDCIDGCQGCENPICYCNVSLWLRNIHDNMFAHHLRTVPMTITWMLVWIRPAKLWANAFWTAKKTAAAKQVVYQILKSNILNALVRFVQLNSFSKPYGPYDMAHGLITSFNRIIVHLGAHVTTTTVICPRRKRSWHWLLEVHLF